MQRSIENLDLEAFCTGCGACANACPVNAIYMSLDKDGFITPAIDNQKCTNCGLCQKVCPAIHFKSTNLEEPKCYAAMADDDIRRVSSSGGIFTILADYILEQNGYVCGAAFDEEWKVKHIIINSKDDLWKLRGSKYVQSEMGDIYKQIESLLLDNKLVLFTGTPCQVSALKLFLKRDYEKLLTVDLVCHGVPSYSVFRKYLEEAFDFNKIKDINFRNKDCGWSTITSITLNNGEKYYNQDYFNGLINNLYLRNSCTSCKFASELRQGDLTLGDFWGIENYRDDLNDAKGTSLVLTNTKSGNALFQNLKQNLKNYEIIPLDFVLRNNPALSNSRTAHPGRKRFFNLLKKHPFMKAQELAFYNKYDVAIVGIGFGTNYGAILTNYAIFELLKSLNLAPLMIDKPRMLNGNVFNDSDYGNTMGRIFMNKYLDVSNIYKDNNDLVELNNKCDIFLVPSDQNWRPFVHDPCPYYFFLDWVFDSKKKIAFATSFGNDKFEVDSLIEANTKYFLNKFDYVSTREDSGVEICKKQLGVNAVQVLDPVFVVNPNVYDKLIEQAEINKSGNESYIGTYVLDYLFETKNIVNYTKQKINLPIHSMIDALKNPKYKTKETPENFLAFLKNASFIITDSFHGVCFSIIFNKPFICIPNKFRGLSRFTSLLSLLGLEDRMVQSLDELKEKEYLLKDMDYSKVNEILKEQKEFSLNWLKNAITAPKKHIFPSFDYLVTPINYKEDKLNMLLNKQENNFNNKLNANIEKSNLLRYKLNILLNKNKIYKQYAYCKLMKLLSFGKLKDEFKNDEISLKQMLDDIKEIKNNFI